MRPRTLCAMLLAALLVPATTARCETPAEAFRSGETALAKGEFPTALQAFATAARADRENQDYTQHYAMTRQIIELRNRLKGEQDPQRWENMARALRAFYVSEGIYDELLKLDQQLHARLATGASAAALAETLLAMDKNREAAATLAALKPSKAIPISNALRGIALARDGKADEAKQIAAGFALPENAGPSLLYAAARLQAAAGDKAAALRLLQSCFEAALPSLLDGFKNHARECPEFAAIAASPEFTAVLQTQSKVPESKCSGGGSCANCPMHGNCPHSQGK